jgi:hypothetical protein
LIKTISVNIKKINEVEIYSMKGDPLFSSKAIISVVDNPEIFPEILIEICSALPQS